MNVQRTPVPAHLRNQGPLATEKQVSYLQALIEGKDLSSLRPDQLAWLRDVDTTFPSKLPKQGVSRVIEQLKELPWQKKGKPGVGMSDVPSGRYAVEKGDGTLMFYSVKNGHSRTFVDVWASDTKWPVNNPTEVNRILEVIKNDPDAGPRFGREIGRCYVCGRTLTDETSRQLGIGPICRSL